MTLAAKDREFVAATANYFPDQHANEFVDSGFTRGMKAHQIIDSVSRSMVVCDEPVIDASFRPSGIIIYRRAPYFAGAMVAATMAFSPPAYASETRPRPHKADALCIVSETEQSLQLKGAVARVEHLAGKTEGWKGPYSVPMPHSIKIAAIDFLRSYFSTQAMVEPFVGLDADGDVTLFWKNDDLLMDLSISENGKYSFYAETKNGSSYEADEVLASTPLPNELVALLQKHSA
ncbi:hypothetical protein FY152_23610 [Agrobacterium tumefaciens]|nr:hypothetical protein FY152_23610 [Agrobacterium tumefaciens]